MSKKKLDKVSFKKRYSNITAGSSGSLYWYLYINGKIYKQYIIVNANALYNKDVVQIWSLRYPNLNLYEHIFTCPNLKDAKDFILNVVYGQNNI